MPKGKRGTGAPPKARKTVEVRPLVEYHNKLALGQVQLPDWMYDLIGEDTDTGRAEDVMTGFRCGVAHILARMIRPNINPEAVALVRLTEEDINKNGIVDLSGEPVLPGIKMGVNDKGKPIKMYPDPARFLLNLPDDNVEEDVETEEEEEDADPLA